VRIATACLVVVTASCAGDETVLGGEPLPDGYIRYKSTPVDIAPGETAQYVEWVSPPVDRDLDLVDVRGSQTVGGHHAILYSSPDTQAVGTNRPWQAADQITARFLGGAGGEGITDGSALPDGAVLRIPAGSGLFIQSHYLNATDDVIAASSTIEIKVADPSPDVTVLSMFVSSTLSIDVPPGVSEKVLGCPIEADTPLVMYVNHIHETGTSVSTVLRAPDGTEQMVKDDPAWNYEWSTDPNFAVTQIDAPMLAPVGATLETRCTWNNQTGGALAFPDEMCGFIGFYIGARDRACAGGRWIEL
jgi:hypothetical protein